MIDTIKRIIESGAYSCVAADEQRILYQASGMGVKPIISPMRDNRAFFRNKYVADTMVGKAAAMLLILSGAKFVYGEIMSQSAAHVLETNGIPFACGQMVEYTKNRAGTGMCPLEQCVQGEEDPVAAWTKIENKIAELMKAEHPSLSSTIQ